MKNIDAFKFIKFKIDKMPYSESFLFAFVVFDILFLPYFNLMSVSFSVPIIIIWMILNWKQIFCGEERYYIFFLLFFMLSSTFLSFFYTEQLRSETLFSTTLKRFCQFTIWFGYYFYFKEKFRKYEIKIDYAVAAFIIYLLLFSLFFVFYPQKYAEYKILINPVDNHTMRYLSGIVLYRFNYLWTDPNNIAYLLCGTTLWLMFRNILSKYTKVLLYACSLIVLLATASNGGLIVFGLCILINIFLKFFKTRFKLKFKELLFLVLLYFMVLTFFVYNADFIQNQFLDEISNRLIVYQEEGSYSGGRIEDFKEALNYIHMQLLFFGTGKEGYTTENGHIYWIGMYGFVAYVFLMLFLFQKFTMTTLKHYIWVLPFFIAFSVNIAIGEFKWGVFYLMLLAESRYGYYIKHG